MSYFRSQHITILTLLALTQANNLGRQLNQEESSNFGLYVICIILVLIAGFVLYDRRQNYLYLSQVREKLSLKWTSARVYVTKLKEKRKSGKQAINADQVAPTSKSFGALQSQKTFVDTYRNSMQETQASPTVPEDFRNMSHEEDTPSVNLKEVFQKENKKGKDSHRSKSKLRGKVQIKKSELEAEVQQEVSCDFSRQKQPQSKGEDVESQV